jgi:hypothetical protein
LCRVNKNTDHHPIGLLLSQFNQLLEQAKSKVGHRDRISMKIISNISEMQKWQNDSAKIAFVPTMGGLHQGHLSLEQQSPRLGQIVQG